MAEVKKSRDKVKTRKEIILAAERLFAERGYSNTSMRDLADEANIKAPTLYHYFSSKNALFEALFEDFYSELAELYVKIEEGFGEDISLRSALVSFLESHQRFIETRPNFSAIFLFEGLRPGSPMAAQVTGLTEKIALPLRKMAARFQTIPQEVVVSLFQSMVGMNLFFQSTQTYQKGISGSDVDSAARLSALTALIGGTEEI
jgi:AcrR family transcriptional regulator